jgi:hypothetical protein
VIGTIEGPSWYRKGSWYNVGFEFLQIDSFTFEAAG